MAMGRADSKSADVSPVTVDRIAARGSYLSGFVELLLEPRNGHGCSRALVPDRDDELDAAGQRWRRDRGPTGVVSR